MCSKQANGRQSKGLYFGEDKGISSFSDPKTGYCLSEFTVLCNFRPCLCIKCVLFCLHRDLGTSLPHLQVLWMSCCSLKDLDGISAFSSLKVDFIDSRLLCRNSFITEEKKKLKKEKILGSRIYKMYFPKVKNGCNDQKKTV